MKLIVEVRARERLGALAETLLAGWTVALAAGLVEVAVLAIQRGVVGHFSWVPDEFVWMTPLSWAVLFTPIAGAVAAGRAAAPERFRLHHAVFLLGFVALAGLLFLYPRIHRLALAALALGLAARAAVAFRRHADSVRRLLRRGAVVLAAVVGLLAAAHEGHDAVARRLGLENLGTPPEGAPNVLLIVLDTVRAASLGLYGHDRPTTPELERIARSSLVFERAIATSSWTLPTHASLFTGRHPTELSTGWRTPLDDRFPTLAEAFASSGWETAGFTANLNYTSRESGLARGFLRYEDYRGSWEQLKLSSNLGITIHSLRGGWVAAKRPNDRKVARQVTEPFLHWLDGRDGARPFFAFLNYFDAHQPYRSDRDLRPLFRGGQRAVDRYDAAIATLDRELGRLFGALRERGLLDGTVVVVTSDHGELFGEHGLTAHGNSLYLPVLRVPLLVRHPPTVSPGRVAATASLRDLPRSLLELAGANPPVHLPGDPIPALTGRAAGTTRPAFAALQEGINTPPEEPVSRGDMHALVWDGFHYIRNGDGAEELYSLEHDPAQEEDLAAKPAFRSVLEAMGARLARIRRTSGSAALERDIPVARSPHGEGPRGSGTAGNGGIGAAAPGGGGDR